MMCDIFQVKIQMRPSFSVDLEVATIDRVEVKSWVFDGFCWNLEKTGWFHAADLLHAMFALVVGRLVGETSAENMVQGCDEY